MVRWEGRQAMDNSFYDLAEVLICDPVASNRTAIRSALYTLGCRQIEMVANLRDLSVALDKRPPDLVLCEAQTGGAELCQVIQKLRQGGRNSNPFVIIIVMAWAINAALSVEISKSGADGVILRPFSAALLDQRIQAHVFRRKRFIITADYVGPERRSEGKRFSNAVAFDPPNSLKTKADNRSDPDEASRRISADLRQARAKLDAETLRWRKQLLRD
jgi:DNA-binding response OmpR family regulator